MSDLYRRKKRITGWSDKRAARGETVLQVFDGRGDSTHPIEVKWV